MYDRWQGPSPAEAYDAWYRTVRGAWIADAEFALMMKLLRPTPGTSVLDVGSGTGHFSRRFAAAGLDVTGLEPDPAMLAYASLSDGGVNYVRAAANDLPFAAHSFDYVAAVTSLCFITQASRALAEMWRVCRSGLILGLLNRHSLLHSMKRGTGSYRGARWDTAEEVRAWSRRLDPWPRMKVRSAVFLPGGGAGARFIEPLIPAALPWGGFLAVLMRRNASVREQAGGSSRW